MVDETRLPQSGARSSASADAVAANPALAPPPLLRVERLSVHFPGPRARFGAAAEPVPAVDDVTLEIPRGQTLGLVGESGSGKSTLARAILRLIPATSGRVMFDGRDVLALDASDLRAWRRRAQIVFQDPLDSLNPRLTVETIVGESLRVHGLVRTRAAQRERVAALLRRVALPADVLDRYPHEFSGGQRQRIGIARALALGPDLLILDEAVSALDVSIQGQILNLLLDLQAELALTYLFIGHNLAVVRHMSSEIAVMRGGRIVERGPADRVLTAPAHEYTRALLNSVG